MHQHRADHAITRGPATEPTYNPSPQTFAQVISNTEVEAEAETARGTETVNADVPANDALDNVLAQARRALAAATRRALTAVAHSGDEAQLSETLLIELRSDQAIAQASHDVQAAQDAVRARDPNADAPVVAAATMLDNVSVLAGKLGTVRVTLPANAGDAGYVRAIQVLSSQLADGRQSAGLSLFTERISADAAEFLSQAMQMDSVLTLDAVETAPKGSLTLDGLNARLAQKVATWGDTHGLLELELEGTLAQATRDADENRDAANSTDRAFAGQRLGEASRLVLLIQAELARIEREQVVELGDVGGGRRVGDVLRGSDRIAGDEAQTLEALGNDAALLGSQAVRTRGTRATVNAEHAFPEHSDAATGTFLADLAGRVETQQQAVAELRAQVVPTSPTYQVDEFIGVYSRWLQFHSPEAKQQDPMFNLARGFYEPLFKAANPEGTKVGAGFAAGFVRAALMEMVAGQVGSGIGGSSIDFAAELRAGKLGRNEQVTGSATEPVYDGKDTYDGRTGEQFAAAQVPERAYAIDGEKIDRAFATAADRDAPLSPVKYLDDTRAKQADADAAWRYFIRPEVDGGCKEERAVPEGVYHYLLALAEHLRTVDYLHSPAVGKQRIGDEATRQRGLEFAKPTAVDRVLEGDQTPDARWVRADQQSLEDAWADAHESDVVVGTALSPETAAVLLLTRELEAYLDGYFGSGDMLRGFVGTLIVAESEYGIVDTIRAEMATAKILEQLATQASIAAAMFAIGRMGWIGMLLSKSITKGLELGGKSVDQATLATLIAWFGRVLCADNLKDARVNAYLLTPFVGELTAMLRDKGLDAVVDLGKEGLGALLTRVGQGGDVTMDDIYELAGEIKGNPEAAQLALDGFETRLHEAMTPGSEAPTDALMCLNIIRNLDAKRAAGLVQTYPDLASKELDVDAARESMTHHPDKPKATKIKPAASDDVRALKKAHGIDDAEAQALLELGNKNSSRGATLVGANAIKQHFGDPAYAGKLPDMVARRGDGMYVAVEATRAAEPNVGDILAKFRGLQELVAGGGQHTLARYEIYVASGSGFDDKLFSIGDGGELLKAGTPVTISGAPVIVKAREFSG